MTKVLIPIAEGSEELEAVTVIDLLRRAGIDVIVASLGEKPVKCARGTQIIADATLQSVLNNEFDLMVLPGGLPGADNLNNDPRIHQLINRLAEQGKTIAAICASPKVLLTNGILNGKKVTAFPGSLDALDTSNIQLSDVAVEVDGKVITSRGPGTAMDFALTLIFTLLGKDARDKVEFSLQRG